MDTTKRFKLILKDFEDKITVRKEKLGYLICKLNEKIEPIELEDYKSIKIDLDRYEAIHYINNELILLTMELDYVIRKYDL